MSSAIYNLKSVILETGLTPETLRAWERRYGVLSPERSNGGHRLYTHEDIQLLKWLRARQEEGLSIRQAVALWRSQGETGTALNASLPGQVTPSGDILSQLRRDWIEACLAFDEQQAETALNQAFALATPEVVCDALLRKGLHEIGLRWHKGEINVQQEHFASNLVMRRLNTLIAALPAPSRPGRILAACPAGEQHELGLLLMAYFLRRSGWEVVYLGANLPLQQLDDVIQRIHPRLIISSAMTLDTAVGLRSMAEAAAREGIPLAFGGAIFAQVPDLAQRIPGVYLGNEISGVAESVDRLLQHMPAAAEIPQQSSDEAALFQKYMEKEAFILSDVRKNLHQEVDASRFSGLPEQFNRWIIAALALGDIHLLEHSITWTRQYLANLGMDATGTAKFFSAFELAAQKHLGEAEAKSLAFMSHS